MEFDELSTFLHRQVSLFNVLDENKCQEISIGCDHKHYNQGAIISDDNSDSALYVVLSGELAAYDSSEDDPQTTELIRYRTGHFFETPNLALSSRINHIKVLKDTELLILTRIALDEIIVSFLRKLSFFYNLPEEQLRAVACEVRVESFRPNEFLFEQDDKANAFYIVISGEVAMIIHSEMAEGDIIEEEIASYGPGSSFGERGVLGNQRRAASAKIKERTALLILPADRFQKITTKYTEIALNLYRYLAEQLEVQSVEYWRAARDNEKMRELIQSAKMAALGQLVAGVAHEINTPVGSISSNSNQLEEILEETKTYFDDLQPVIEDFYKDGHLESVAKEMGYSLNDSTRELVQEYINQQNQYIRVYYENDVDIETLFQDMKDISDELGEASDRIKEMVRSLARFARLDEAEHKKVDVHEGLESTLALLRHELKYKVIVEKEYDEDLPEIICYPNQLNQVFMNILSNAIQALELDKLQDNEKGYIRIKSYQEDGWAVISIGDTGTGIEPNQLNKIFEPYFSTKGAAAAAGGLGLGLGLSISQKIIQEKHLGKLEVESEKGKGSTFFIKLPLE